MLKKELLRIPEEYRGEFLTKQIIFVKQRIYLFCSLAMGLYFFTSITGIFINPSNFKVIEILMGLMLVTMGGVVFYLNHRVRTLWGAKLNAYLFTVAVLLLLVKVNIAYSDDALASSSLFVFTLFLVSMTIPWAPSEVVPIWLLHIVAFTVSFMVVKNAPAVNAASFNLDDYFNGFLFLTIAFALCVVVRRKESMRDIENFVLFKKVEDSNTRIRKELEWAMRVHKTIIPGSKSTDKLDIGVSYLAASYIGGDYVRYDFLSADKLIFFISDITGHGVPAALLVNRMHAEFERLAQRGSEPGALLKELNKFIKEEFKGSGMYLSAFCGLLDLKRMRLLYSNYGHPPQYLYSSKGARLHEFYAETSLLGLPMDDESIYQQEARLGAGDKLLMYTDGITETRNAKGEEYGERRLKNFFASNHNLSCVEFNGKLLEELVAYKSGDFKDDICIMSIGIKGHLPLFHWQ